MGFKFLEGTSCVLTISGILYGPWYCFMWIVCDLFLDLVDVLCISECLAPHSSGLNVTSSGRFF